MEILLSGLTQPGPLSVALTMLIWKSLALHVMLPPLEVWMQGLPVAELL